MLTQPLYTVKTFIQNNPNGIFVWVKNQSAEQGNYDCDCYTSIQISPEHAIKWCEQVTKDGDDVPCIIGGGEIFLGVIDMP